MPPERAIWNAHPLPETFKFHRRTSESAARISFLVMLDGPGRYKGRVVEVSFYHAVALEQHAMDVAQAMQDVPLLPDVMGSTHRKPEDA